MWKSDILWGEEKRVITPHKAVLEDRVEQMIVLWKVRWSGETSLRMST